MITHALEYDNDDSDDDDDNDDPALRTQCLDRFINMNNYLTTLLRGTTTNRLLSRSRREHYHNLHVHIRGTRDAHPLG